MDSEYVPTEEYDTFETRARTSPLGLRPSSSAIKRPLGRATTFGQEELAGRTTSTEEVVKMYKQRYSMPHMRQVTFIRRFRETANELQSQPSRLESSVTIPMDGSEGEPFSPLLTVHHTHTYSAPAFSSSNSMRVAYGVMYSSLIDDRARQMKEEEAFSNTLAYGRLAFEILFTFLAVLAAIIVAFRDGRQEPKEHAMFLGVPLLSWLILAAMLCPTIRLGDWLVDGLVKVLEWMATTAKLENVHYTLIGLSDALKLVATALLVEFLVLIIMRERTFDLDDNNLKRINRTSLCFVVFALVDLAKTLGCRLLSLRVNAESVFDLLKDTIEKERILNTIMTKSRHNAGVQSQADRYEAVSKLRSIPDWSVGQYLSNLYDLSLPVDSSVVTSFTDRITELVAQFRTMTEPELDEHATCAAEYCWLTVRKDLGRDTMLKEDLAAVLSDEDDVEVAFGLFDRDRDGYVTEPEVHARFQSMYRQRRNLASTLRDNDGVIGTLEMLTGIIMHLLAFVAYAAIFRTDVGHLLISLSSISVASAFVFGNSLKTIYESVVFLFVIRPYQVGDKIFYKDALHSVKNFGLLSTQFVRFDGRMIWVPNETLMASDIVNVTQSRNLVDRLTFEVDMDKMRPQLCEELAGRVLEMMNNEEPRRLFSQDTVPNSYIVGVTNPLKYTVGLTYNLAVNGETFAKVAEARTLVNHVIGTWFQDNKLTHSTSIQPLYTYGGAEKLAN